MPTVVAYHLDPAATPQPQPVPPELAFLQQLQRAPDGDAEGRLVHDVAALADGGGADQLSVDATRRGAQLEVTVRGAGVTLPLSRVEPVARKHGVAVASACSGDGVVTLWLLLPRASAVHG